MKKYILVEGITDVALIKYICVKKGITKNFNDFKKNKKQSTFKDLIIIDLGGEKNLSKELPYLKDEENEISKIGIIQDTDKDFEASEQYIKDEIKASLINPSKIKYFLTPNNGELGDLETLLLSTIQENSIIKCFDSYKQCLEKNQDIHPKALNKGQVYAYTMYYQQGKNLYKPQDSFMYERENIYQDTGLWNLEKDEFEPIINFVVDIFGD